MRKAISLVSFALSLLFLVISVRSKTCDEGVRYKKYYRSAGGLYNGNLISLSWGRYGIGLLRVVDFGMQKVPRDGIGRTGKDHTILGFFTGFKGSFLVA